MVAGFMMLVSAAAARADEPLFGYTYTTDLLPRGKAEITQWSTTRIEKAQGSFWLEEARTEVEYGVTDKFQLSGYLNYAWTRANGETVDGTTSPPETFAGPLFDPNAPFRDAKFIGVSVEGIYRILSPYTDPIGFAVYAEPTIGPGLRELETRAIVQKNFRDDRLVWAFNALFVQEVRSLEGDPTADPASIDFRTHWDHESDINLSTGISYRFAPSWSIGAEFMNEREFSRLAFWKSGYATNSAYDIGPVVHYGGKHFYVTATFLTQLPWASDYTDPQSNVLFHDRNYADDFEKYRVRIKTGFYW
jgi:hypothetical protein